MRQFTYSPRHRRVAQAKLARGFSPGVITAMQLLSLACAAAGATLVAIGVRPGFAALGAAVMVGCYVVWIQHDLLNIERTPLADSTELGRILPAEIVDAYRPKLTGQQLFTLAASTWDGQFILDRYQLNINDCLTAIADSAIIHQDLWATADTVSEKAHLGYLTNAMIIAALFTLNPELKKLLTSHKLTLDDLYAGITWAARLGAYSKAKRPIYGGVARDWAAGFTPLLNRFGTNLSSQVEFAGKFFRLEERTTQLDTLVTELGSTNGSVVLVGEPGIGKTAILLGLADRLLQGVESGHLAHHQIISLSASGILAEASSIGSVEQVVMALFDEAIRARNIVLALDEAQLFFGQGVGAVNLSQVLMPYLQSRSLNVVLAVTPGDWQRLKAMNAGMASLLSPLILSEPNQTTTISTLADRSLLLEGAADVMITYSALMEAYRLSGRYIQEEAYPGKALKLLEASINHAASGIVAAQAVQAAVEAQYGVKVGTASQAESDVLLGMEDKIHERMINQTRAVSVVSNALRRARAGVANPKRPIGSFLFLGPTGVGKTELARSLAAVYFNDETNLIRLDMSEYQQIPDVDRILADATTNPDGLLPSVRAKPFSVVLFDEIEKAHPNVLNLFLQLLDEGSLTDLSSHPASFKDAIIIATSNAGADDIRRHIEAGEELQAFEQPFIDNLINSGQFRPELLNRFDEIVLFRPLKPEELKQVVAIMVAEVNKTLEPQQITVKLTDEALAKLVEDGYDPRLGARPMRRMVTRRVEDAVAGQILRGQAKPGDVITLDAEHLETAPTNSDS